MDDEPAAQRDEAWSLVERAVEQMFGGSKIMTHEELRQRKRVESRNREAESED